MQKLKPKSGSGGEAVSQAANVVKHAVDAACPLAHSSVIPPFTVLRFSLDSFLRFFIA